MKKILEITVALAMAFGMAKAGEMQTIQDDAGRTVTVPKHPKRIISGHDAIVSVPLIELGFNLVGSTMRKDLKYGGMTIFGIRPLFGKSVKDLNIAYVGGRKGLDFETIRSLNPDIFIAYEGMQKHAEKFKGIAPVFINRSRLSKGNEAEYLLASRFGKMDVYNALDAKYKARLAEVKAMLPFDPTTKTYLDVLVSDKITAMNYIGGINKVMNDLGFKTPKWLAGTTGRAGISAEEVKKLDVDVLFMSTAYFKADRAVEDTDNALSKVVPGWSTFLNVKKNNGIIYYDSYLTLSPTFVSAMNVLDYLETHFKK